MNVTMIITLVLKVVTMAMGIVSLATEVVPAARVDHWNLSLGKASLEVHRWTRIC